MPPDNPEASEGAAILFVCTGNAGRSQMAQTVAQATFPPAWTFRSAGVEPWDDLHPMAVRLMAERDLSMEGQYPKPVDTYAHESLDAIVTLGDPARRGCREFRPDIRHIHWPIDDPADADGTPDSEAVFRHTLRLIEEALPSLADALR